MVQNLNLKYYQGSCVYWSGKYCYKDHDPDKKHICPVRGKQWLTKDCLYFGKEKGNE